MCGTNFNLRLGLDVRIDRKRDFIGLVVRLIDRSGFGFLLREAITLFEGSQLQTGGPVHNAVELALQALIGVNLVPAFQQEVEGVVKIQSRRDQVPGLVIGLSGLELLFSLVDQGSDGVWLSARRVSWELRPRPRRERRSEQAERKPA